MLGKFCTAALFGHFSNIVSGIYSPIQNHKSRGFCPKIGSQKSQWLNNVEHIISPVELAIFKGFLPSLLRHSQVSNYISQFRPYILPWLYPFWCMFNSYYVHLHVGQPPIQKPPNFSQGHDFGCHLGDLPSGLHRGTSTALGSERTWARHWG